MSRIIPVTYVLKDDHGEELEGTFCHEEIQKEGEIQVFRIETEFRIETVYRIETVSKHRRGRNGHPEYLVQWFGCPSSFNSRIPKTALTRYSD